MSADFLRRIAALERIVNLQAKEIEQLRLLIEQKRPTLRKPPNDKISPRSD